MALTSYPKLAKKVLPGRDQVILLGDSLGDVHMADGLSALTGNDSAEFDLNVVKVGFLNTKVRESLPKYKAVYDVLIFDDGSLQYVNTLLHNLLQGIE